VVTGYDGGPFTPYDRDVVAANPKLHPALLQALSESRSLPIPGGG